MSTSFLGHSVSVVPSPPLLTREVVEVISRLRTASAYAIIWRISHHNTVTNFGASVLEAAVRSLQG